MSARDPALASRLDAGLHALQLSVPAPAREQLLAYLEQLHKWNKAYNLSGIRELRDRPFLSVTRHGQTVGFYNRFQDVPASLNGRP